jgi:hypothetical protein
MEHPEDALPEDFVDAMLSRLEASAYLAGIGVRRSPRTLAKILSTRADGPPCVHEGRYPRYAKRGLHEWGMRKLTEVRARARSRVEHRA